MLWLKGQWWSYVNRHLYRYDDTDIGEPLLQGCLPHVTYHIAYVDKLLKYRLCLKKDVLKY